LLRPQSGHRLQLVGCGKPDYFGGGILGEGGTPMSKFCARSNSRGTWGAIGRVVARWALALFVALIAFQASGVHAQPYCVLRKSTTPPNCFEFYLADTTIAPPGNRAVLAPGCMITPLSLREGWEIDPTVPGPHMTKAAGDAAIGVVSPYHGDFYGCRSSGNGMSGGTNTGTGTGLGGGVACQETQTMTQPESRDETGRITVEAAIIHVMECPNQQTFYIYEYQNRAGFRVIKPPGWAAPIGGRDVATMGEALGVAMDAANNGGVGTGTGSDNGTPTGPTQGAGPITVTAATYGQNCGQPRGNVTSFLAAACNGKADCTYEIHWETIGDPAYGCQKDFIAEWSCGPGINLSTSAAPEAGYGSTVRLACSN